MQLQHTIFHFDIVDNERREWVSLISTCLGVAVTPVSNLSRTGKAPSRARSFTTPFHSLINWLHLLQLALLNGLNMISLQCSDSLYSSPVTVFQRQSVGFITAQQCRSCPQNFALMIHKVSPTTSMS